MTDKGVAALVVGDDPLLVLGDEPALALGPGDHAVDRLLELGHPDLFETPPGRQQGRLVHQVGQVGAGEPGRAPGQHLEIDTLGERLSLGVHVEDRPPPDEVGTVDDDLAIESSGPEQGGVEDVGTIGGGDEDHAPSRVEAVHLDQQLVQRLFTLVVAAAQPGAAVAADRVDLVDEDDRRRVGLGLLEQVAYAAGTDADEHLDEVRT